ncbi:MAG: hypothetical protein M0P64_01125 [Candidatus Pacebacteria bacterium]|jgi:hypothetical protein|nr:hypothetical protein [Candidatus Paceibacterota bacterium]
MKALSFVKKYKILLIAIFLVAATVGTLVFQAKKSEALGMLGFGGYVASVTVCTCSTLPTYYVSLGPPTGGEFLLTEALSEPFQYYDIWGTNGSFEGDTWVNTPSGPWLVGSYSTGVGAGCMMLGEPCYSMPPAMGTILQYGTSLGAATTNI